jgi:hypothetical protein
MSDQTTTAGKTVVVGTDPTTGELKMDRGFAVMFPEAASNIALDHYKRQSQANIDRAIAVSRAAESSPAPGSDSATARPSNADLGPSSQPLDYGEFKPLPADKVMTSLTESVAGKEAMASWSTFADDLPYAQAKAAALLTAMPPDVRADVMAQFEDMSATRRIALLQALAADGRMTAPVAGDPTSIRASTAKGNAMQTDNTGMPTDQELAAADAEVHKHFYNFNRGEAAAAQARRDALYARRFPGSIVGSQGRTI